MSSKKIDTAKSVVVNIEIDPTECPFREFRDTELSTDYWGMGPAALRATILTKVVPKYPADYVWTDDQTQPLPRSVRQYLHGWIRAEELAMDRWEAEVAVFEDNESGKMSVQDTQLSHAQVMLRSSFCRRVMSACFVLERTDGLVVEHQWENFSFTLPEGWRAKYHIYSPGIKPGGGLQHRPGLSKTGCYLVRLYHLGAWRCVWVSDQVPVDATDSPLLPFSPLLSTGPKNPGKSVPNTIMSSVVQLWPLLICKALLKLAAPDMNSDENIDCVDDEIIPSFNIVHALTGALELNLGKLDIENLWDVIVSEVPVFAWDDDDDTVASTIKSRSTKKPATRETAAVRRGSMATVTIEDTKNLPPYTLPGITPCHETTLVVFMARDVPIKKPLPEPEVALWKYYRWVDWARRHGLYEAYDCPRTRFLKVNGLLKLSYAPHLLDVQSTDSITIGFREEHDKTNVPVKKGKDVNRSNTGLSAATLAIQKEELREWVQFDSIQQLILNLAIIYFPSMFQFTTTASAPPVRITKGPPNRALDIVGPKSGPLYLQIDGPDDNSLKLSLSMLHPRILMNSGVPVMDYIEPAYMILEMFEWFLDSEIPKAKAYVTTRGYDTVQVGFLPGRHFCRLWIHSRMNWHVSLLSESSLLLGTRDQIMTAAVRECPWVTRFLNNLGTAFSNWIRVTRSNTNILLIDREFYRSYQPDLTWDPEVVGYEKHFLHWMFRRALQTLLYKKMPQVEFDAACVVLRRYFCDPDFGLPDKPPLTKSVREIVAKDPCDCTIPEPEGEEMAEECQEEQLEVEHFGEEKPLVRKSVMDQLLVPPTHPITSQVCELATEELPCGILKEEREKVVRMHEAATLLQAYWRGTWVRRCLKSHVIVTPEIYKSLLEHAFGTMESLSTLMNEFFSMYPGAKYAYSAASGLSGVYGLQQHSGITSVTPLCKWIPYFQGVFFCHAPVKVHFDVHSSLQFHTVAVYDNDTGLQMPQVYGAHITFDFSPNQHGYTVMGHGTLTKQSGVYSEVHWQLTVLACINDVFHICDNNELCNELPLTSATKLHIDEIFLPNRRNILYTVMGHGTLTKQSGVYSEVHWQLTVLACINDVFHICDNNELCNELPLTSATKLHIDEIFLPNRRNILGGIQISVMSHEAVSFRAAATSPDLEMVAILRATTDGVEQEVARCAGKGELYWPYIRLQPAPPRLVVPKAKSVSQANLNTETNKTLKGKSAKPLSAGAKNASKLKLKGEQVVVIEPKKYKIEVICPYGWPLTLPQWQRVDEVRNTQEPLKVDQTSKKPASKPASSKEKDNKNKPPEPAHHQPEPGDAYVELECALVAGGGATARRDDDRDQEFAAARRAWDANEPGRNLRGAMIRKEFRTEFLEALPPPPSESLHTFPEEFFGEELLEGEFQKKEDKIQQGPTPASESGMIEMSLESEEEAMYLSMPDQLRDKFIPLYFVPLCTKEKGEEESVVISPDMAEAAKAERHMRYDAAIERMRELQTYNEIHVLGRQRKRCMLLEKVFIDSQLPPEVIDAFDARDDSIAKEVLLRSLSATKKKLDGKKK